MTARQALFVAWAGYVVAWALPVVRGGVTFPHGLPGWEAFRVAASPVWPYQGIGADTWYGATLSVASAATNFIMLLTPWFATRDKSALRRIGAAAAAFAFLVNAQWVALGDGRDDLRAGYYLWWFSFLGVGIVLWLDSLKEHKATQAAASAS